MARFPYHQKNISALGKLIAKAASDGDFLNRFRQDPSPILREIGLPTQTVELIDFKVIARKDSPKAVAIPYKLNSEKLRSSNPEYLSNLSKMFALN